MPYVSVRTSASVNADEKLTLQKKLSELITVIPGKTANNCMIDITGGCDLFMRGGPIQGAFVDLRLFKPSPDSAKGEFVAGLAGILKEILGIEAPNIYVNIIELPQWGTGDRLS